MIEAMTYRHGHHSTSDDSSRYRNDAEVCSRINVGDPFHRMSFFLCDYGVLDANESTRINDVERFNVLNAIQAAEKKGLPPVTDLFEDVYKVMPHHLEKQQKQHLNHLRDRLSSEQ